MPVAPNYKSVMVTDKASQGKTVSGAGEELLEEVHFEEPCVREDAATDAAGSRKAGVRGIRWRIELRCWQLGCVDPHETQLRVVAGRRASDFDASAFRSPTACRTSNPSNCGCPR